MSTESQVNGFAGYLSAFVIGAAAGVAIALLTAPRSGRETRERLRGAALDLGRRMEQVPGTIQRAVGKAVKAGQSVIEQAREEVA